MVVNHGLQMGRNYQTVFATGRDSLWTRLSELIQTYIMILGLAFIRLCHHITINYVAINHRFYLEYCNIANKILAYSINYVSYTLLILEGETTKFLISDQLICPVCTTNY